MPLIGLTEIEFIAISTISTENSSVSAVAELPLSDVAVTLTVYFPGSAKL